MITPSFGLTATERVLPKLALDFTTANLDSRVTFTRTTNATNPATYIDSSGLLVSASNNEPRFDYDPVTLVCRGLLIEESRANLIAYSNDFNSWPTKTNVTLTTGIDDPAGGTSAITLTSTAANGVLQITVTGTTATNYTSSIWIRRRTGTGNISLRAATTQTRLVTPTSSWTRVSTTGLSDSTTIRIAVNIVTSGDAVDIYGAQLEAGAFATSYIPTTTTALTRNADVATMTGTNFSDWFNATQGTFVTQAMSPSTFVPAHADNGTAGVSISTRSRASGVSGTAASVANISEQLTATNFTFAATNKVALAFKENDFAWSLNGATPATDTSGTLPTVDRMRFGSDVTSTFSGHLQKVFFYPQRLTTAEVQAFSK